MKKLFTSLILATVAVTAGASTGYNKLTVHLADETVVDIKMAETLTLCFTEDYLTVRGTDADVDLEREKIVRFEHSYDPLQSVETPNADTQIARFGNTIIISGLVDGARIVITDASGMVVYDTLSSAMQHTVDLGTFTPGIYILSVNANSMKIIIR